MQSDCIFCKIINREIPAKMIAENEYVVAFQDISPAASIHYLIAPKKHIADLRALDNNNDHHYAAAILFMAQELSQRLNGTAFRLVMNNGKESGQTVHHMHAHFLVGKITKSL